MNSSEKDCSSSSSLRIVPTGKRSILLLDVREHTGEPFGVPAETTFTEEVPFTVHRNDSLFPLFGKSCDFYLPLQDIVHRITRVPLAINLLTLLVGRNRSVTVSSIEVFLEVEIGHRSYPCLAVFSTKAPVHSKRVVGQKNLVQNGSQSCSFWNAPRCRDLVKRVPLAFCWRQVACHRPRKNHCLNASLNWRGRNDLQRTGASWTCSSGRAILPTR